MSHKSTIKMKISDKDSLLDALKSMGIEYEVASATNALKVNSSYGVKADVDVRLKQDSHGSKMTSVGFKKNADGTYEAVGDFYEVSRAKTKEGESLSESQFKKTVSKRYSYFKAISELTKNGFTMASDVTNLGSSEYAFVMQSAY